MNGMASSEAARDFSLGSPKITMVSLAEDMAAAVRARIGERDGFRPDGGAQAEHVADAAFLTAVAGDIVRALTPDALHALSERYPALMNGHVGGDALGTVSSNVGARLASSGHHLLDTEFYCGNAEGLGASPEDDMTARLGTRRRVS